MTRSTALALASLAFALMPRPARAWGAAGHEVVALIAQDRLSGAALNKVRTILGPDVGLDKIAVCADAIKHAGVNCGGAFFVPKDSSTDDWHFIDIPDRDSPDEASIAGYCRQGGQARGCVVDQVNDHLVILGDPHASRRDKQLALMFVVHLVGDAHQPLHCTTEFAPDGTSDRGGNGKPVQFDPGGPPPADKTDSAGAERVLNLHALWDNIVNTPAAEKAIDPRALATKLESDMNKKSVLAWQHGDVMAKAALESFNTAKTVIYPQYKLDQGKDLGKAYQDKMQPIAYERLEQAGARLALLLEAVLGAP